MKILLYLLFLAVSAVALFYLLRVALFKSGLIHLTKKWWRVVEDRLHVYQFFKVPEFSDGLQENELYRRVFLYLNSLESMEDSDFTNLFTGKSSGDIVLRLDPNQVIDDYFLGARVSWINGDRSLVLKVRKADKRRILRPYLQHIHTVSDELEERKKDLKLYMNVIGTNSRRWRSVPFTHPSTFDTIAMESDLKVKLKSDLESFLRAKQYYHRLGRVWKRSYLLYGPSGTGKSSFVAAMANFLSYDVYEIDLSRVRDDSDLRTLLLQTTSRSVIVIEDLDRFLTEKSKSSTAVTMAGMLNFMDGVLNSCAAEERIMVFTMNSKDLIDPTILRPGRIDVHIHFPLCDFSSFKTLASSYLGLKDHKLFPQVEEIFQSGASLSPAEIGELMIANRSSPSRALKLVITALQTEGDRRGSLNIGIRRVGFGYNGSGQDEQSEEHSGIFSREGAANPIKDIKKLYGLLKMKSSRKSESFEVSPMRTEG
ncbi:AAA-ATPase At2g46620 [Linum perenne]